MMESLKDQKVITKIVLTIPSLDDRLIILKVINDLRERLSIQDAEVGEGEIAKLISQADHHYDALRGFEKHDTDIDLVEELTAAIRQLLRERDKYKDGAIKSAYETDQILGKALGYPWYKDDLKNFPGATEKDGVCTADHIPETLAAEALDYIRDLEIANEHLQKQVKDLKAQVKDLEETIEIGTNPEMKQMIDDAVDELGLAP